jgi:hypothetical protein
LNNVVEQVLGGFIRQQPPLYFDFHYRLGSPLASQVVPNDIPAPYDNVEDIAVTPPIGALILSAAAHIRGIAVLPIDEEADRSVENLMRRFSSDKLRIPL